MNTQDVIELDDTNWEKNVEKGGKPIFVMFYSPTCPYCKQMEPHFYEYAAEFKDKVLFARVNTMNSPTIAGRYGIMGTPTFKFFCKGRPVQELSGAMYPTLLKKIVEEGLEHGENCVEKTSWVDPGYA
ncbi:MAG: thioredoxin fold domain-containing protein [Thermoplasmatales archaeon]|nr:MAG: thioredoxin fold domain-containing protein [Thermoplasmatales archaeon]